MNPFIKIDELVAQKQAFETEMIKSMYHTLPVLGHELTGDAAAQASIHDLYANLNGIHDALEANVKAAVVPVRYSITVTPE